MTSEPVASNGDLPERGLFVGGSAGSRMGLRPLGDLSIEQALSRPVAATTCLLLWDRNVRFLIDLGTGLRSAIEFGRRLAARDAKARTREAETFLALTHYHEDHWCGLRWCGPFAADELPRRAFSPILPTGFSRNESNPSSAPLQRLIERLDEPGLWPTPTLTSDSMIEHEAFEPGATLRAGGWRVRTCLLPHPGGCVGYRFEMPGGPTVVVATDCEFDESSTTAGKSIDGAAEFFDSVDVLILDVQYRDREYDGLAPLGEAMRSRVGWGHNSPRLVARRFADLASFPKSILVTHHDPDRALSDLRRNVSPEVLARFDALRAADGDVRRTLPIVCALHDGDVWSFDDPATARRVVGDASRESGEASS